MKPEYRPLEYAAAFAPGLTNPETTAPEDVVAARGKGVVKRYNVYRNNVTVSLIDALAATYPAVQRITGVEFFRAMARFHVRATPPVSQLLFEYGRDFPSFIESYEYARDMPWLADTAHIERAWLDAYHAADAAPLKAEALVSVDPSSLAHVRFVPHPAARIVRSRYPAVPAVFERCGRCARHSAGRGRDCFAPARRWRRLPHRAHRGRAARRRGRSGVRRDRFLRPAGQSGSDDFSWRVYRHPTGGVIKMSTRQDTRLSFPRIVANAIVRAQRLVERLAQPWFVQLVLRIALAVPFWKSGILKWHGFLQLNDTAIDLFTDEFRLHLPGGPYPFPAPAVFAFLSACGEVTFPVLLVLGLGTRLAAAGLLLMTCIIELTVPDGWPIHITWAAMALGIAAWGPGLISIDSLLGDRANRS